MLTHLVQAANVRNETVLRVVFAQILQFWCLGTMFAFKIRQITHNKMAYKCRKFNKISIEFWAAVNVIAKSEHNNGI